MFQLVATEDGFLLRTGPIDKFDIPQPHPLPMPEYGGYFAPLTEYLPDSSQPISGFHRYSQRTYSYFNVYLDLIWS